MTKLNRPTFKQQHQDYIDRVAPFDTDPLIQKAENQTVIGENLADSVIFLDAEIQAINGPGATINLDFTSQDQFNIDTQASVDSTFTVNLTGLSGNADGLVNIIKKSGDTFTFAGNPGNALFSAIPDTRGQSGKTEIRFRIKSYEPTAGNPTYVVEPLFDYSDVILNGTPASGDLNGNWPNLFLNPDVVENENISDGAVDRDQIVDGAIDSAKIANGTIQNSDLQTSAVTADKIQNGTLTYDEVSSAGEIARHDEAGVTNVNFFTDGGGIYPLQSSFSNLPPMPIGGAFEYGTLTVTIRGNQITQTAIYAYQSVGNQVRMAVRYSTNSGGTWSSWVAFGSN
jgi:hypothetical protein